MDSPGHLLSLKVMRISRPALATAWEPFYSNSPAFSAHSTASVLSLQGGTPLPGHPKTLRDLTNASTLLTLPSSFGAIQLGETFSGALAVNNESAAAVDGVVLRVEMQTATNKALLAEIGGPTFSLTAADTLETVVGHEIKELGQHVLACTVTYQLPPGARRPAGPVTESDDNSSLQTFRKFYKFAVTNPLSVKTKVHIPRSPSAVLSPAERSRVFLEVHIQNLTQEPMWFERMIFEPAPGWLAQDANLLSAPKATGESIFSGSTAMMQPQDARQYLYSLTEVESPAFPVRHAPGTVIGLGRLDISWRSSFGEPGRLLTSMLSRRIPLIQPTQAPRQQQPASALPLHLQRAAGNPAASLPPSRSSTPPIGGPAPYRPASPSLRNRPSSVPPRTQSPAAGNVHVVAHVPLDPIDVDLVTHAIVQAPIAVHKRFPIAFTLGISVSIPEGQARLISLVVQHVQLSQVLSSPPHTAPSDILGHRTPAFAPSPTFHGTSRTSSVALEDRGLVTSPKHQQFDEDVLKRLPPPVPEPADEVAYSKIQGIDFVGPSTLILPSATLRASGGLESLTSDTESEESSSSGLQNKMTTVENFWEFELEYKPTRTGYLKVGGLRVILVEDRLIDEGESTDAPTRPALASRTLREWDVVGEIWVTS
ncbi:DUF974-domain-containing protein [Auriscalpium vulgare]|uniref:DUF974-domain-containing protein n=1 Tax=Auriscalpium vulgare TaxID=40419 RepID=A0ACB8RVN2_9AGAM|nr:DUF974-domain-containing protein [Auriscalpium vulgare]